MSAPLGELQHFGGVSLGTLGPGCRHPLNIANGPDDIFPTVLGAQDGVSALLKYPWDPMTKDSDIPLSATPG